MSSSSRSVPLWEHLGLAFICVIALGQFSQVEADIRSPQFLLISFLVQLTLLFAGVYYFRRADERCEEQPSLLPIILITGICSLLAEPLFRLFPDGGSALEVVLVRTLKNQMLLFAMACCWRQYHPFMVTLSVFVFLFSVALSAATLLSVLLIAIFLCCCTFWLIFRYLQSHEDSLHASQQKYSLRRFLSLAIIPLIVLIVLGPFASGRTTWSLQGFLPTSGGEGGRDSRAMGGIGNGEALVAGHENVQTFAPIDDAPFREGHDPSLFDAFNDAYGEPFSPTKSDRKIALTPEQSKGVLPELSEEMKKLQDSGRQFSTLRQQTTRKRNDVEDVLSKAIFHVVGRVPLHLRMETYDFYDGVNLISAPDSTEPIEYDLVDQGELHWLEPREQAMYDLFAPEETHVIKVIGVDDNIIPTPLHWTGISIRDLEVRDFYREGQYRVMHLDRQKLPELVPIHLRSRVLDERHFDSVHVLYSGLIPRYVTTPDLPEMDQVRRLARTITARCPRRRDEVEAIVRYIRENYRHEKDQLDREVTELDETDLSVHRFLFEDKSGTDFEFATATMLLLRSLDISSRVVSGFYVDPENYDREKDHTSVYTKDIHFWCEVHLGGNVWNTLEPTPGYEKLAPPMTFYQYVEQALLILTRWLWEFRLLLGCLLITCAILFWQRRPVMAFLSYWNWRFHCCRLRFASSHPEQALVHTRRLIDRFLNLSGNQRPRGIPLRSWMMGRFHPQGQEREHLTLFLQNLDQLIYGTPEQGGKRQDDPIRLSNDIVRHFHWSRFRRS